MIRFIIILLFYSSICFCQSKVGTTAASFLGIGVGSRSIGMAGAVTAYPADASVAYWNPGAIAKIEGNQVHFTNSDWLVGSKMNMMSAVFHLSRLNAMGIYITHLDYGDEKVTTLEQQNGTGDYWSASDMAIGAVFSQNLTDRFAMGGTVKYIHQSIYHETASSGALDLGLIYQNIIGNLRLGMNISNIGFDMIMDGKDLLKKIDLDPESEGNNETITAKLKTDYWPLPIFFRVGVSSDIIQTESNKWTISIDGVIPSDDVEYFNIGTEYRFYRQIFLQAGFRQLGKSDSEESFTLGLGAKLFILNLPVEFNYTYQDFGIFGGLNHMGMTLIY